MGKRVLYALSDQWRSLVERAESLAADPAFRAVKQESRTLAGFVTGGHQAFLKRFHARSFFDGLLERMRGSRAARSLDGAALLRRLGFHCPTPLAAMESRLAGSVRASYLLSEALTNATTLSAFIDRDRDPRCRDPRWRTAVLAAVAREVARLHGAGLFSSDLQETNLMLEETAESFRVYFVDLERFSRRDAVPWERRVRNLVQLDRSIGRFARRSERLRFLYTYLGRRPARPDARRLVSELLAASAAKEREYSRRRARRAS